MVKQIWVGRSVGQSVGIIKIIFSNSRVGNLETFIK